MKVCSRKGKEEKSQQITTWSLRIRPQALNLQYIQGTVPIAKILIVKNAWTWLSMVSYFKKYMNIKICIKEKLKSWIGCAI